MRKGMKLPDIARDHRLAETVQRALEEDIGSGDVTTRALVSRRRTARAVIRSRRGCVVSGGTVAAAVFRRVDPALRVRIRVRDGKRARAGQPILEISGRASSILTAERTALNFMQRMTGVATLTRQFVQQAGRYGVAILDTRKTTPGLRFLEKYAVLCGGGRNHRIGLFDMALIKDNHRRLWRAGGAGSLADAVRRVRDRFPGVPIEIEVESEKQLTDALAGSPDWVLLDNMSAERMRRCVRRCRGRVLIEASGGITLDNVRQAAASGVAAISLGCLTHSAPAADLSLEITA
jgi:nicotinate-nucleotide pyrophosphorylase (carboxylating)